MTPDTTASDGLQVIPPTPAIRWTRYVAVGSLMALIALCLAWELWLAPLRPRGSWLALKALPLCIPLAGLLRNRMYTYRWVSLMIWLYFCEGVVRAWGDPPPIRYYAIAEIVLCLVLFVSCSLHVRLRFRAARSFFANVLKENAAAVQQAEAAPVTDKPSGSA